MDASEQQWIRALRGEPLPRPGQLGKLVVDHALARAAGGSGDQQANAGTRLLAQKMLQARDSSRKRWRYAHATASPAGESREAASSRLRMDDEDARVLSLLQDSDLDSSVLSERHQRALSLRHLEAAHHVTRDDLRAAPGGEESGSQHRPDSTPTTPRNATPLRSTIRLLPSASSAARPMARSSLGEGEGAGRWEETSTSPWERDSVVAVGDKVLVSEDALRRLVAATHERDVLLQSLATPRARLVLTDRGAARPHGSGGGVAMLRGADGAGGGVGADEETLLPPGLLSHVAADMRSPGASRVARSPQGSAGKPGTGAETGRAGMEPAVREMRLRLEEALAVAEQLRQDKKVLNKELHVLQNRWAASRKIAEKARLGEKDVSQSLCTLSGEHRDLVQRLIQQRQEHATKTAALYKEASSASQALARITNVLIANRVRTRLRRAALRAWKTASLDSLLHLLAKSALVLKCAAVAHTRSALRSALRTAARAWWERTQVATTAVARAGVFRTAHARLRGCGLLRLWRVWARGARRVGCSARAVGVLLASRQYFRTVAHALGCWREGTPSLARWSATSGAAVRLTGIGPQHAAQTAWLKSLGARRWRAEMRAAVHTWHQAMAGRRRARLLERRASAHGTKVSLSLAWVGWQWTSAQTAGLRRLALQGSRRSGARILARAVKAWGKEALRDARRKRRLQRTAAKWSRARACRAWAAWKGRVVALMWKGRVAEGALRRCQRRLSSLALFCWCHCAALRRRHRHLARKALERRRIACVGTAFAEWVLGLGGAAGNAGAQSGGDKRNNGSDALRLQSATPGMLQLTAGGVEEARERGVEELLDAKDAQIARLAAQIEDLREAQQRGAAGAEGRTGGRGEGDGTSVEEAKAEVEKVLKLLEDEKQRRESLEQERALER